MSKNYHSLNPLVLGTSQMGSNYGVTNKFIINDVIAGEIINFCGRNKIKEIDTAIDYENSEKILGKIGISEFSISTKLPKLREEIEDIGSWIDDEITHSLQRLNTTSINTLYLHNPKDLQSKSGEKIYKKLEKLKVDKIIKNIGISVYSPSTLMTIINEYKIDVVQFPFNVFDNRFNNDLIRAEIEKQSIKVYLRSIFLQGLLLTKSVDHHDYFHKWKVVFEKWENWLDDNRLSPVDACLNYAFSNYKKAKIIVGVSSLNDLKEITNVIDRKIPSFPKEFWSNDIELVDPRKWKL